jgi:hypothetical protein
MLLLAALCLILVCTCQKVRLGFLNVRSVRALAAFNISERIGTLCRSLNMKWMEFVYKFIYLFIYLFIVQQYLTKESLHC